MSLLSTTLDFLARLDKLRIHDLPLLREVIREHNTLYHREEAPIISDSDYDRLFHALARAESDFSDHAPDSPTARLAVLLGEQFEKYAHRYPMISLDNTYDIQEVAGFEDRMRNILKAEAPEQFEYVLELKFDGLGLALIYEYGQLVRAVTRGSGREGEIVTANALEVASIPQEIPSLSDREYFEVRGEIVMPHSSFAATNRERAEK